MADPFTGLDIPPLLHSIVLLVGTGVLGVLLYAVRPPVSQRTVLAFVPWIITGGTLHVFYQLGEIFSVQIYPPEYAPFFSAPAVYLSTFIGMGFMWTVSVMIVPEDKLDLRVPQYLGATGIGVALPLIALVFWQGLDPQVEPMEPIWPVFGLVLSIVVSGVVYFLIGAWRTHILARAKYVGGLVIFAHVFDAITTTIGVDVLGAGEQSAVPRTILNFTGSLPLPFGSGWLFILIKVVMASAIVIYFTDSLRERETQTNLLFAFVAALGLGPGAHNFFLFVLSP